MESWHYWTMGPWCRRRSLESKNSETSEEGRTIEVAGDICGLFVQDRCLARSSEARITIIPFQL
jgi:hypothetical protein